MSGFGRLTGDICGKQLKTLSLDCVNASEQKYPFRDSSTGGQIRSHTGTNITPCSNARMRKSAVQFFSRETRATKRSLADMRRGGERGCGPGVCVGSLRVPCRGDWAAGVGFDDGRRGPGRGGAALTSTGTAARVRLTAASARISESAAAARGGGRQP